ncbi:protein FAR1-RELATED SEQUENCE 5-like [Juglans microcarpa x Juglans regia]|uniref:protein FAR1-RELATED SEQUENCE 5-like n=1 Tax=Juglans microcarpa x Juglans regia TaxID=2249226 RepID=UPI001B7F5B79|nr:protein FAR1-RELATED SEQUENCE 5-like [Juglans microcarpa x Juglans regia]
MSARVSEENRPDCLETEPTCSSTRVDEEIILDRPDERETDDDTTGTPQVVPSLDGDDIIEELKSGMEFNLFEDLLSYYKQYAKKCGFGVMTQRSERSEDQGGFENLIFLKNDCRNYIDKTRHLRLGASGAGALRDYFMRMQYKNNGFFALINLGDDGRLKNVFWANPCSWAAYQYFGDVVTFDTTYLTNRYGMPFAPFVNVNHHEQSILLGVRLISSEDMETFTWLFQTWLQGMDGIAPNAIITDQDRVMKNAIATVFLETRHRLCLWHILKKVPKKLGLYAAYRSGLKTQLMKFVYDTQTIEEFEKYWAGFINTYDLHENVWLKIL